MRKFSLDNGFTTRHFYGFDKDFTKPHRLVLCQNEDCLEVWAVDDDEPTSGVPFVDNVEQLLRFFTASESKQQMIGTYGEKGFLGFKPADRFVCNKSRFA